MVKYLKRTWKNKVGALVLMGIGYLSIGIDNDATFFVFALMFAIPLFLTRKNHNEGVKK